MRAFLLSVLAMGLVASPALAAPAGPPSAAATTAPKAEPPLPTTGGAAQAALAVEDARGETGAVKPPATYLELAVAGGPVMVLIGLASIVWLAFLIERLASTRRARVVPAPLKRSLAGGAAGPAATPEKVAQACAANPSAAARVLGAALAGLGRPREEVERVVNQAARREVHALRRHLRLFAILASVSPLLGLLGTVTGLIGAFRQVAVHGLGQGQAYAAGIYEALANTAAGLLVAIPSLLTYYWLNGRIEGYVHEIDGMVVDLVEARGGGARP